MWFFWFTQFHVRKPCKIQLASFHGFSFVTHDGAQDGWENVLNIRWICQEWLRGLSWEVGSDRMASLLTLPPLSALRVICEKGQGTEVVTKLTTISNVSGETLWVICQNLIALRIHVSQHTDHQFRETQWDYHPLMFYVEVQYIECFK